MNGCLLSPEKLSTRLFRLGGGYAGHVRRWRWRSRLWDDARAGSKTRNTQEIQGNKRGQRVKQTRQMKEKHCLTLKTSCSVTKSGREKRGAEVSLGAGNCCMCAHAAQSSANIDNMHRLSNERCQRLQDLLEVVLLGFGCGKVHIVVHSCLVAPVHR